MMLATYYCDSEIRFLTSTNPTNIYQLLHYHECYGVVAVICATILATVLLVFVLSIIYDLIHAKWIDNDTEEEKEDK